MLNPTMIGEIKKIIFQSIDPALNKAFIFGSRATGGARTFSDIDIGIEGKKLPAHVIYDLKDAFEQSNIPYTVDIIQFDGTSPQFKEIALKKVIYLS